MSYPCSGRPLFDLSGRLALRLDLSAWQDRAKMAEMVQRGERGLRTWYR